MSNIKDIQEAAQKYADKVEPFIWPKNKHGEEIEQRVGQNPPNSRKHKVLQQKIIDAFLAGSHSIGEEIVKQLEDKMPDFEYGDTAYDGYRKCIETLRSIINQQSLNNKEGMKYIPQELAETMLLSLNIIANGDPISVGLDEITEVAKKGIDAYNDWKDESPDPTPFSAEVYRKVLQELVDLKETKESVNFITNSAIKADYEKRKPLAWAAAKEILSHSSQPEQVKGEDWISVEKALRFSEWAQWQGYNWNQTKNLWYYHPTDDWFTPNELFLKFKNTP